MNVQDDLMIIPKKVSIYFWTLVPKSLESIQDGYHVKSNLSFSTCKISAITKMMWFFNFICLWQGRPKKRTLYRECWVGSCLNMHRYKGCSFHQFPLSIVSPNTSPSNAVPQESKISHRREWILKSTPTLYPQKISQGPSCCLFYTVLNGNFCPVLYMSV